MFSSTIIATVGRPTLARAVNSMLDQNFSDDGWEVIVVNDSGSPLTPAAWQLSPRVRILHTNKRERSVARNVGAASANGRYLHFLDDDDWMAPGALSAIWELSKVKQVAWLYGSSRLVDSEGNGLVTLNHDIHGNGFLQVMAGEWIPLQSSFISAESFFEVSGFHPLLTGPEDIDLLRRISLCGDFGATSTIIAYVVRNSANSTTNYAVHSTQSRWAREQILKDPTTFSRMREQAITGYWVGRLMRIYLTSIVWNLHHKRFFTAINRTLFCFKVAILTGQHFFSRQYWRSIIRPYSSETFNRGLRAVTLGEK